MPFNCFYCFSVLFSIPNQVSPVWRENRRRHNSDLCVALVGSEVFIPDFTWRSVSQTFLEDERWKPGTASHNRCSLVCGESGDLGPRRSSARDGLNTETHTCMQKHYASVCTHSGTHSSTTKREGKKKNHGTNTPVTTHKQAYKQHTLSKCIVNCLWQVKMLFLTFNNCVDGLMGLIESW